jgi:hypothetical protein
MKWKPFKRFPVPIVTKLTALKSLCENFELVVSWILQRL